MFSELKLYALLKLVGIYQKVRYWNKKLKADEQRQINECIVIAMDKISDQDASKCIRAYDKLHRIAEKIKNLELEIDIQKEIFEPLFEHLRKTTKQADYINSHPLEPREDIQKLLSILFNPHNPLIRLFPAIYFELDLAETYLNGANLQGADLQGADLRGAKLNKANLQGAHMQNSYLQGAKLNGANLQGAHMKEPWQGLGPKLENAELQGANLQGLYLTKADLKKAKLQKAELQKADLRGVNISGAELEDAYLQNAKIDKYTMDLMPENWKSIVDHYIDEDGIKKTGALLVNEYGEIILHL